MGVYSIIISAVVLFQIIDLLKEKKDGKQPSKK